MRFPQDCVKLCVKLDFTKKKPLFNVGRYVESFFDCNFHHSRENFRIRGGSNQKERKKEMPWERKETPRGNFRRQKIGKRKYRIQRPKNS